MKLLFVQKSTTLPLFGPMWISSVLKENGHDCDLIFAQEHKDILEEIKKINPDLIGFTVFTGEHQWIQNTARTIKRKLKIPIVMGGPHATYYPETLDADYVCIGEGDHAILELMNKLEKNESTKRIKNFYPNQLRPLIQDLDSLPQPDREIYYKYDFLRNASVKQFLAGRGCPFECTFCSNHILKNMYKGQKFVRYRNPENVIDEIKNVKENYGLKTVSFTDDVFISNARWLDDFLKIYKKELDLPFICNARVELLNEKIILKLKSADCYGLSMGIESGNEFIRNVIMNKKFTNEQVIKAGRLVKKHGMKLKTYNIIGSPHETVDTVFETIELNAKIKPDQTSCSFLQPYPKYRIANYAIEHGFLAKDFSVDDVSDSIYKPIKIEIKDYPQIENLQTFFLLLVKNPSLKPLVKQLIKLPPNPFYRVLAKLFYGYYMSRVHKLSLKDMLNYSKHCDPFKI